jgi:ATP-binding cassette subfamily F protein uup
VFEGDGIVREFDGGYDDWQRQKTAALELAASESKAASKPSAGKSTSPPQNQATPGTRKLSFKKQRELEAFPKRIEELENLQQELHAQMADPTFYQKSREEIAEATAQLEQLKHDLSEAFDRWALLESKST